MTCVTDDDCLSYNTARAVDGGEGPMWTDTLSPGSK